MNQSNSKQKTTHFGYQEVPWQEKVEKVGEVFSSVANHYDLMNDLMSFGIHRLWKRYAISLSAVKSGESVLDLAGGTGDLTYHFAQQVGSEGSVVLADINSSMLRLGRDRLIDQGILSQVNYAQVNAENLPFQDNSFDCVSIAFGLRNVTDKNAALASMFHVLKPGGRVIILEFSKPIFPLLNTMYDIYSFSILPKLGEIIAKDAESYRYLAESIRMHPDQESLKKMIQEAGFEDVEYQNLSGGIVAIHRAYKY